MAYFGPFKCCSLRIFVFAIGILFLLVQTTFLIVTFVLMRDIETHVENWFNWMTSKGIPISNYWIIKKSGDYLAIPITVNVVLIISDTLLIWASASKNKLLLWPWIILHCLEWLFFIAMLIYLMVIVPKTGFKVVVFLVGSPIIVMLGFFWTVVKLLHNYLRDLGLKSAVAAVYHNGYRKDFQVVKKVQQQCILLNPLIGTILSLYGP